MEEDGPASDIDRSGNGEVSSVKFERGGGDVVCDCNRARCPGAISIGKEFDRPRSVNIVCEGNGFI